SIESGPKADNPPRTKAMGSVRRLRWGAGTSTGSAMRSAYWQRRPDAGLTPRRRYASTAESTHELPRRYAVWPSPSYVSSVAEESWEARACAHAYGVAGSRMVPTTRIGAAPAAVMVCGRPVALTGQYAQARSPQARPEPNTGDAWLYDGT